MKIDSLHRSRVWHAASLLVVLLLLLTMTGVGLPSQSAVWAQGNPQVQVAISVVDPASGIVGVGGTARLRITITNGGADAITLLPLRLGYSFTCFRYQSASPAPNLLDPTGNTLSWSDLVAGSSLAPGVSQTVDVAIESISLCTAQSVTATVAGAQAGNTAVPDASASASLSAVSGLAMEKVRLSPSGSATVGDTVTFQITVRNDGAQEARNLELVDTFDGSFLKFLDATPAPTIVNAGSLQWPTLATSLLPGSSLQVTLRFQAVQPTDETINRATLTAVGKNDAPLGSVEAQAAVRIIYEPPVEIPEPATIILFGTGLAGLAGAALRKRRQQ